MSAEEKWVENIDRRDEAWKDFAHSEGYGYTDSYSNIAFDAGWEAAMQIMEQRVSNS